MTETTTQDGQPGRSTAPIADDQPRRWRPVAALLGVGSCALAAGLALVGWHAAKESLATPPVARSAVSSAMDLVSNAAGGTAPAATESSASAPLSPPSPGGDRDPDQVLPTIARELNDLRSAHERLAQRSLEADLRIGRIEAEFADLKVQLNSARAAHAQTRKQASALARQLELVRAAAAHPKPTPPRPRVLSIDTWNGRPSVAVQVGEEVRFVAEGDVIAGALVRKADPATQRVEFLNAAGAAPASAPLSEER